jgi:threonine dehydratase
MVAGCDIYCKLEYLQRTGSFKERGARNALTVLDPDRRERGVIAASAGNHALGLAYHASLLRIPVTVVMPRFAPLTKVINCEALGANVVLHGDAFDEAREHAMRLVHDNGLTYINGFDDPAIIAGQGTLGLEMVEQVPDLDAVLVPVGGGGLIAGVALAIKTLRPTVTVIGVEGDHAPCFSKAWASGHPVDVEVRPSLADGLAVRRAGANAFGLARQHVDKIVTVDEQSIARAVLRLVELEKSVVEGAGAVGLAALMSGQLPELKGKKVVLPLTGGNIDTSLLGRIIERGLAADGRLCRFEAPISDRPGSLSRFTALIADAGASVKDIAHDRAFAGEDVNSVVVRCIVETRDAKHIQELREQLTNAGFTVKFWDLEHTG